MANDRMYMRCRACGDMLPLGKHLMDGWYGAPTGEALQEWIDKHAPVWVHESEYDQKADGMIHRGADNPRLSSRSML